MAEDSNGPLARMGNARAVLKTILDFGAVVAEVGPLNASGAGLSHAFLSAAAPHCQASCWSMYKSMGGKRFLPIHPNFDLR